MPQLNELELAWLQKQGATSSVLMDAWAEFFDLLSIPEGNHNDRKTYWLRSLGYFGSLTDMEKQYYCGTDQLSLYVNPLFEGGDSIIPAGTEGTPPDNHTFSFFTVDCQNLGSGVLQINSDESVGRRNLTYDLKINNPDLEIGAIYRLEYLVTREGLGSSLVMSLNAANDINVIDSDFNVLNLETKTVYIEFAATTTAFEGKIRVGCGPTNDAQSKVTISRAKLIKKPNQGTPFVDSNDWVDPEPFVD